MIIRKAIEQDIPEIKELADSLIVTPDSKNKTFGFYDYSLTVEQYERRRNHLFLVSCKNSELEGFCMAYDSEFARELMRQEPHLKEDVVFNYLTSLSSSYVYVDQLAVRQPRSFVGSLSACRLIDKLKELSCNRTLISAVPHYPWKNEHAIKFHEHQGTRLVAEIGSKEKIIFGVYHLNLT